MLDDPFQTAVLVQEFRRGFGTDSGNAGDVICAVAHHAQEVDDLQRFVHVKLLPNLIGAPDFSRVAAATRTKHPNLVGNELTEILVRRHHVHVKVRCCGFFRQESDDIVRFVSHLADGGHVQAFQYLQNPRHRPLDVFRRLVAVRFVLGIRFVAERPPGGIEYNGQTRGSLVANDVEQRIGKAKNGARVQAL